MVEKFRCWSHVYENGMYCQSGAQCFCNKGMRLEVDLFRALVFQCRTGSYPSGAQITPKTNIVLI